MVQGDLGCEIMVIIYHSLECLPWGRLILRGGHFSLPNRFTLLRNVCLSVKTKTWMWHTYLHCYDKDNENSCWQAAVYANVSPGAVPASSCVAAPPFPTWWSFCGVFPLEDSSQHVLSEP